VPIEALRQCKDQFDDILRVVNPKRIAADMARADKAFHFRNFKGYRPSAIGRGRLRKVAAREIFAGEGHELFANVLIIHWNNAKATLYREMVAHVKTINEDVEAIEQIPDDRAHAIIDDLLGRHDRVDVLLCVRLNGVRFREEVIESRLVRGEPGPAPAAGDEGADGAEDRAADGDAEDQTAAPQANAPPTGESPQPTAEAAPSPASEG